MRLGGFLIRFWHWLAGCPVEDCFIEWVIANRVAKVRCTECGRGMKQLVDALPLEVHDQPGPPPEPRAST